MKVDNKVLRSEIENLSLKIKQLNGFIDDKEAVLEESERKRINLGTELNQLRDANKALELKNIELKSDKLRQIQELKDHIQSKE